MFGGIAAALILVWLYQTAATLRLPPLPWAIGGLIVFYGVRYAWTFGILKPSMGLHFDNHSMLTGVMIEISGAIVAAMVTAWFRSRVMLIQRK